MAVLHKKKKSRLPASSGITIGDFFLQGIGDYAAINGAVKVNRNHAKITKVA